MVKDTYLDCHYLLLVRSSVHRTMTAITEEIVSVLEDFELTFIDDQIPVQVCQDDIRGNQLQGDLALVNGTVNEIRALSGFHALVQ